jgi:iron complex transport system substrate-binding protein
MAMLLLGVGLRADAHRVVSLIPATTEMLFAMGGGDRVVGIGNYDRFPPEASRLPRVGGLLDPDVERILSLRPDLVVVYETQGDLRRQLERARIPLFLYRHRGLADITDTIRALGASVGLSERGRSLAAALEGQIAAIRARVGGRPRPRTLLIFGRQAGTLRGIEASGGVGFLHDMLEAAGGADALNDIRQQSVTISAELVLARAPEVIVELRYSREHAAGQDLSAWNALASVPAVRNHRVHLLQGEELVVPGPRVAIAIERLAQVLHPEVFR